VCNCIDGQTKQTKNAKKFARTLSPDLIFVPRGLSAFSHCFVTRSKKKKFTQQKSRKFQNTMEGPHRRPNLPRKKCQSKKPHPQKQPNHQRANKQASRAHNWQNRAYNWDEDSDFGDYLPTHCKKQSNSQHSYTSRNRPAFADPEYHHPKFRQAKAQPPRSRQRTVRHSLKQLFQDYSEEEHDAHPPKHWLSAQSRQQRKKQNATRNHLQSTPTGWLSPPGGPTHSIFSQPYDNNIDLLSLSWTKDRCLIRLIRDAFISENGFQLPLNDFITEIRKSSKCFSCMNCNIFHDPAGICFCMFPPLCCLDPRPPAEAGTQEQMPFRSRLRAQEQRLPFSPQPA